MYASAKAEATLGESDFQQLQAMIKPWAGDQERREYMNSWKRGLTGPLNYYRAAALKPTAPPLKPITVPTMVIWGEKDSTLLTGNLARNLRENRVGVQSAVMIRD